MKLFELYSLAPIFYNVGIIGGALLFVPIMGSIGLAWGVVLGAFLHLIIQFVGVNSLGYKYQMVFDPKDSHVRQTFWQMLPRMLGLAVNQINFLAMTVIASTLAVGSVTLLQFAYNLNFFAIGAVAVPYSIAAYPTFCEQLAKDDRQGFIKSFSSTVRQILFFMIPATVLFVLLRAQVVRVVLGAGQFGWSETITTANTLGIFVLSLVAQSIVYILVRAYFAKADTFTPLVMGLVSAIVNIFTALFFTKIFGVLGFGMAYSISAVIQVALLWVPLRLKVGGLDESKIAKSMLTLSLSGLACALITQAAKTVVVRWIPLETFWAVLLQGLFAGLLGLAVYCLVAWFLKSEELHDFLSGLKRKLLTKTKPSEAVVSVE
jgi:putative peptidoglycan lipid II flippase